MTRDRPVDNYQHHYDDALNNSIHIDILIRHVAKIFVIRLLLAWNEKQLQSLQELDSVQRGDSQVHDQAVQHRKWEELQHFVGHYRDAH